MVCKLMGGKYNPEWCREVWEGGAKYCSGCEYFNRTYHRLKKQTGDEHGK